MNTENKKIEEELREIAPFLAKLKAEQTEFVKPEIPKQYFDELSSSIFEQTILQPKAAQDVIQESTIIKEKSRLQLFFETLLQPNFAVLSMSVVLLIVSGIYLMNHPQTDDMNLEFTAAEIENYVTDNIENFELEQLADLVVFEETESFEIPELEKDILEDYIEDNFLEEVELEDLL